MDNRSIDGERRRLSLMIFGVTIITPQREVQRRVTKCVTGIKGKRWTAITVIEYHNIGKTKTARWLNWGVWMKFSLEKKDIESINVLVSVCFPWIEFTVIWSKYFISRFAKRLIKYLFEAIQETVSSQRQKILLFTENNYQFAEFIAKPCCDSYFRQQFKETFRWLHGRYGQLMKLCFICPSSSTSTSSMSHVLKRFHLTRPGRYWEKLCCLFSKLTNMLSNVVNSR